MVSARFVSILAFACLLSVDGVAFAISSCLLSDSSRLELNGSSQLLDGPRRLRLTPAAQAKWGSAFSRTPMRIDAGFSVTFDVTITGSGGFQPDPAGGRGGDGFTFAIVSDTGVLGLGGSGLGYRDIHIGRPSVAVEFDTWRNGDDVNDADGNHVGIDVDGSVASRISAPLPFLMTDNQFHVWIDYDGARIDVRVAPGHQSSRPGAPLVTYAIDLARHFGARTAYFGFTGSTGAEFSTHDILAWLLTPSSELAVVKADLRFKASNWNLTVKRGVFDLGAVVLEEDIEFARIGVQVAGAGGNKKAYFEAGPNVEGAIKVNRKTGEVLRVILQDQTRNKLTLDLGKRRFKLVTNRVPNPIQGSNGVTITVQFGDLTSVFILGGPDSGRGKVQLQPTAGLQTIEPCR